MTDLVPLTTRQTPNGTVMPAQAPSVLGSMPEKLQMANALAVHAQEMLPKAYHGKPGACLMLIDYCERNDLSLFEAGSEVSFNRGRSSVSARLQKKLAARVGFRTVKVDGDDTACTVAVLDPTGAEVGRATYTFATAEALGIIYENGRSGQMKSTWFGDRGQMLFHRATTRALDHYGPSEYAWAFQQPDYALEPDPLAVLTSGPTVAQDEPEPADAITDAEVAPELASDDVTADELMAAAEAKGIKPPRVKLLKHAQTVLGWSGGTIDDIVADQAVAVALLDAVNSGAVA